MATYVLGDIHGQLDVLERLLGRLPLKLRHDRLWLVGDLVNRGPHSLEVLRWARRMDKRLGGRMAVVLGNHDLRLLALAAGIGRPRPGDTLDSVLNAPDRDELCGWLRSRPLIHRRGNRVMVHAGLLPSWTVKKAEAWARKVEKVLQGDGAMELLADWRGGSAVGDPKRERRRQTLAVLTGIRTCTEDDRLCDWSGPPGGAPSGCVTWFQASRRRSADARIVFGHWAALGVHIEPRIMALDSGAAWGGQLTALRLGDGALFQESVREKTRTPAGSPQPIAARRRFR